VIWVHIKWALLARSLFIIMILSSTLATLSVSEITTALITTTKEKPMTNLCDKKNSMYHSLTFSTKARHHPVTKRDLKHCEHISRIGPKELENL